MIEFKLKTTRFSKI